MKWLIIFVLTFLVYGTVISLEVDKCNDTIPGAINFESEGCTEFPCPLVRGTTSNANITFRIPADTTTSTINIKAQVSGLWVPFPPPDSNTCHNLVNSFCPLQENEIVVYNMAIPISKTYPKMKMVLQIQFLDEKKEPMMCLKVPCAIVDAPSL